MQLNGWQDRICHWHADYSAASVAGAKQSQQGNRNSKRFAATRVKQSCASAGNLPGQRHICSTVTSNNLPRQFRLLRVITIMQCTLLSRTQCLRAPVPASLKHVTCPSFRCSACTFVATPLPSRRSRQTAIGNRHSHLAVRVAATSSATFYDYSVKVWSSTTAQRDGPVLLSYGREAELAMQDIDGRNTQMKKFKGKVVLAVNVASQCGFTKQYKVSTHDLRILQATFFWPSVRRVCHSEQVLRHLLS